MRVNSRKGYLKDEFVGRDNLIRCQKATDDQTVIITCGVYTISVD